MADTRTIRVPADRLSDFGTGLFMAAGVDEAQAKGLAENLTWNDAAERHNHGYERARACIARVAAGGIACPARMSFETLGESLARLDAGNGFGQVAGTLAIDRACDLAEATGIGVVGVRQSNFFGTGAAFVARATARGLIAFALSNSFPKVAAHGGQAPVLGTNPLAFGAPRDAGADLIVDFSTAALAGSTLREAAARGETLPEGLAIDPAGAPVTNPATAGQATLLPAAGAKGFGLALMVEVLAGVLTGAGIGSGVGSFYGDSPTPADSGHFFLVLDPARWMAQTGFAARMDALADMIAASDPTAKVRLPGALRADALARSADLGVTLTERTWAELTELAGHFSAPIINNANSGHKLASISH